MGINHIVFLYEVVTENPSQDKVEHV
jgi:hypothetical protein